MKRRGEGESLVVFGAPPATVHGGGSGRGRWLKRGVRER